MFHDSHNQPYGILCFERVKQQQQQQNKTKISGKGDSLIFLETFKMTAEGLNRIYSFRDYLHVNSVLWITVS